MEFPCLRFLNVTSVFRKLTAFLRTNKRGCVNTSLEYFKPIFRLLTRRHFLPVHIVAMGFVERQGRVCLFVIGPVRRLSSTAIHLPPSSSRKIILNEIYFFFLNVTEAKGLLLPPVLLTDARTVQCVLGALPPWKLRLRSRPRGFCSC